MFQIQYTLFLKELGMSWIENAKFWACYYSKECKPNVKCCCAHSWNKDHKKFLYNIRHLYGLEGGKISYGAHSCRAIQVNCPFYIAKVIKMCKYNMSEEQLCTGGSMGVTQ